MQATTVRGHAHSARAVPAVEAPADAAATAPSDAAGARGVAQAAADATAAPSCRICWQEADDDPGGCLLSPCRCSGSQRFVHQRCLSAWMRAVAESKGLPHARRCDVCRAPYRGLPREMRLRESPWRYTRRQAGALLDSPFGTAASYYAAGGLVFSVVLAMRGAWCRLAALPDLVRLAQEDPLQAAQQLAPDVLLSVASEAFLSGSDQWMGPLISAARLIQGLSLRILTLWAQEQAASALPRPLLPLALAACQATQLAASLMQYTHMGLLLLFGGLSRGFARGALLTVRGPARLVAGTAHALCRTLAAAASMLPFRRRRRRQRRGKSTADQLQRVAEQDTEQQAATCRSSQRPKEIT